MLVIHRADSLSDNLVIYIGEPDVTINFGAICGTESGAQGAGPALSICRWNYRQQSAAVDEVFVPFNQSPRICFLPYLENRSS